MAVASQAPTYIRKNGLQKIWMLFFISFLSIVALWFYSRPLTLEWSNVPPAPSHEVSLALALGDKQMAYRSLGMMLQSFGNNAGRYERLIAYDYDALKGWFYAMDELDPRAEFLPFLATYYYGASTDKAHLRIVADFLYKAGMYVGNQKWRWLAQAVYIARYRLKDTDYAMFLAKKLADHDDPDVGAWARNMQAIILENIGEKQAALTMSLSLLKDEGQNLSAKEIFYLQSYICDELLEKSDVEKITFCATLKGAH